MLKIESFEYGYNKRITEYRNSCPRNIGVALLGIVILLFGMWITSLFLDDTINTIINIIVVNLAIVFVIKNTYIEKILGKNITFITVLIYTFITLFNIWLGLTFIYKNFFAGTSIALSNHYEHSLMYSEMSIIASRLSSGMTLDQATYGLPLYQYYNIFVYSSIMFLIGGINVTNMCIWGTMHTALCPIFVVLLLDRYHIKDKKQLRIAYFVTIFQPLFLSVNTYNKVIIGETLIIMAMYIYISTYDKPLKNLMCLPIYGYLFWTVRLQYFFIAGFLFIICLIHNKVDKKIIIPIVFFITVATIFISQNNFIKLMEDLNVSLYIKDKDLSLWLVPARLIRSMLPYFPLTNVFNDQYWYFNIFCIFQEIMNITLWGFIFIKSRIVNIMYIRNNFKNPLVLCALVLFLFGTFSELHTTYLSVGTMLLLGACEGISGQRIIGIYFYILISVILISVIYAVLGLSGSGLSGINL